MFFGGTGCFKGRNACFYANQRFPLRAGFTKIYFFEGTNGEEILCYL